MQAGPLRGLLPGFSGALSARAVITVVRGAQL
jgi:hypothetical protein